MIVGFIDVSEIVDYLCLNFLFDNFPPFAKSQYFTNIFVITVSIYPGYLQYSANLK